MTDEPDLSRRRLFGMFGRGIRGLKDALHEAGPDLKGASPTPPRRVLRDDADTLPGVDDRHGGFAVDLSARAVAAGDSVKVAGADLFEAVVVVRVTDTHWAACSSECPVDGSDVVWDAAADRLRCPSCSSRWRLDGEDMGGPADSPLGRYFVDVDGTHIALRPA